MEIALCKLAKKTKEKFEECFVDITKFRGVSFQFTQFYSIYLVSLLNSILIILC